MSEPVGGGSVGTSRRPIFREAIRRAWLRKPVPIPCRIWSVEGWLSTHGFHAGRATSALAEATIFVPDFGSLGSNCEGSYAEFVCVPASNVHTIADGVSFETAAATPTVYLPTWNILIRKAQLKPWETVLVLSASAGVGTAAIQVAKSVVGATVITTTSSAEKATMAKEIGADHVINYTERAFPKG